MPAPPSPTSSATLTAMPVLQGVPTTSERMSTEPRPDQVAPKARPAPPHAHSLTLHPTSHHHLEPIQPQSHHPRPVHDPLLDRHPRNQLYCQCGLDRLSNTNWRPPPASTYQNHDCCGAFRFLRSVIASRLGLAVHERSGTHPCIRRIWVFAASCGRPASFFSQLILLP
jgi:hypothetical protein